MPDFNDVVRHIILRIVVDSAGLAEELAKARGQLKAAEQAEKESNKARSKDAEQVTKAYEKQTQALRDNSAAHDDLARRSDKNSQAQAERIKAATKDIQDATRAQTEQIKAVESAKDREHKRNLERYKAEQAARTAYDKTIAESAERMSREQQKLNEELSARRLATTDENLVRQGTRATRIETEQHVSREQGRTATGTADSAEYAADLAKTTAINAENARINDTIRRRRSLLTDEQRSRVEINNLTKQGAILEERALSIAEARERSTERYARTTRSQARQRGLKGVLQASGSNVMEGAVALARTVTSAPKAASRAGQQFDAEELAGVGREATAAEQRVARLWATITSGGSKAAEGARKVAEAIRGTERAQPRAFTNMFGNTQVELPKLVRGFEGLAAAGGRVSSFFGRFGRDAETGARSVARLRTQVGAFFTELNRARAGGSSGSLLGNVVDNTLNGMSALNGAFKGLGRHLISFQNLIVVVVAAFGPLAAILGGVGAAALGLVSNLAALSGSLLALPGLISAAVGAFGLLAVVIKPLSSVFSAYSAAQKAAAKGSAESSAAAIAAANALQDAQRKLDDANLAHQRAIEDLPRAYDKLSDARKQAKRDIEDYRTALAKLKYDEEGSALDVESAQQAYKRALVDPTSTSLDRRQARHDVEGALFDQKDQQTQAARTMEDAAEAFKKGVEGADAVVAALRAIVDAQRAVADTATDQKRATQDLSEANKDAAAGGSAARTATEAYEAELAKLGPKTRQVAEAMIGLTDSYKDMRNRLSDRIFGQITGDTDKFKDVLAELEAFLGPTADAFGKLAHQAILLFTNPEWKRFFTEQGKANGKIIETLGEAALSAADGFRSIIEIARPFTDFVVNGVKGMADAFKDFAASKEGRDSISDFLELTQQRMRELWKVVKNLAGGFAGFFAALNTSGGGEKDFTSWFNDGLIKASENFKKLGDQARDPQGGFQTWLRNVRPLLSNIVGFLKSAGQFFGDLFSDPDNLREAENLLKAISEKWLPKLADIFDKLSQSGLISQVADAIGKIFDAIDKLGASGGVSAIGTIATSISLAAGFASTLLTTLGAIPGLLQVIGVVIAGALIAKFSGLSLAVKGLIGLFQGLRNIGRSVQLPDDDDGSSSTGTSNKKNTKVKPGTIGDVGRDGSVTGTPGSSKDTRSNKRTKDRPATSSNTPTTSTPKPSTSSSTGSKPSLWTSIKQNTKDTVTGDTKLMPTMGRMEVLLRQIEINTRKYGKGTGSGTGTGGGGGGGSDDDSPTKKKPTGGGSGTSTGSSSSRRTTSTTSTIFDDDIPTKKDKGAGTKVVKPTGTTPIATEFPGQVQPNASRATPAGEVVVDEDGVTRVKPTGSETPAPSTAVTRSVPVATVQNEEANRRRVQAGLPTLPDSHVSSRRTQTTAINTARPTGQDVDPNGLVRTPVTPNSARDKADRLDTVRRQRNTRLDLPEDTPYTAPAAQNLPYSRDQRRQAVAESAERRRRGLGTVPTFDENGTTTRQRNTFTGEVVPRGTDVVPSSARRKQSTVIDGEIVRNELPGRTGRPALPGADEDDTRALGGKQSQRELATTASPMALPAGRDGKPKRDRFGRFTRTTDPEPSQPRDASGRFRKTTDDEPKASPVRDPQTGRFVADPSTSAPARDSKGRFTKTRQRFTNALKNDSGSVGLGIGTADDYEEGYSDGLRAGDSDGRGKKGKKGSRFGRRNKGASLASSLVDDFDDDFLDDDSSGRRGKTTGGREGGRLSRLGGGIKGLGSRFGGSLGRGLIGGGLAAVAGGALQLGGDAVINKFVKNDKDKASLSGGLSAVTTGASLGAMFGPAGALVGGAVGGIYALFKDKNLRDFVEKKLANLGKLIVDGLKAAGSWIANFFTKTIPSWWSKGVDKIGDFFTETLPKYAAKAATFLVTKFVAFLKFWYIDLPLKVLGFFAQLAIWAGQGVVWLLDKFVDFLKFWYIDLPLKVLAFFGDILPKAASGAWSLIKGVLWDPFLNFIKGIPGFFTETIPHWFEAVGGWFKQQVIDPISDFFTVKIPEFFTKTIPNAIKAMPGWIHDHVLQPIMDFFSGLKAHVSFSDIVLHGAHDLIAWVKGLFGFGEAEKKMSGGLIQGVYQGIQDKAHVMATPGEFMFRKSVVDQPGAKAIMNDWNEGRLQVSDLLGGLAATTAPQVRSIVPPNAQAMTGAVPTVVNNTVNHAPLTGDITIHNPVREKTETSLRRQLQLAANRHRR